MWLLDDSVVNYIENLWFHGIVKQENFNISLVLVLSINSISQNNPYQICNPGKRIFNDLNFSSLDKMVIHKSVSRFFTNLNLLCCEIYIDKHVVRKDSHLKNTTIYDSIGRVMTKNFINIKAMHMSDILYVKNRFNFYSSVWIICTDGQLGKFIMSH